MKNILLPIGKMAEINHITISTLRLYDKLGLLPPRYIDPETGYRYYDVYQNARLDMIAYMKEVGMSLGEIKNVLQREDVSIIEEVLAKKNELLHEQMRELKSRHSAVERAIASIERYRKSPVTGTTSLEYIDRRYTWGIPCRSNFYEGDIGEYEKVLIELRKELIAHSFQHIHSYHIGTSISAENFQAQRFIPGEVFIFLERSEWNQPVLRALDSGMYACMYLDQYNDEIPSAKKLLRFCTENHYCISGDYLCEVMTEFNVFSSEKRSMFLRLQVPVTFH